MASTYLNWELLGGLLRSWRSQRRCMMGQFAGQGSGSSCSGSHFPAETASSVGTAWRRSQRGHPGEWLHQGCYKPWSSSWGGGPELESLSLGFYQRHHARRTQDPCTWLQQKWGLVALPGGLQWRWEGRNMLFLCSDDFIPSNNFSLCLHFVFHSKRSDTQSPWTFISISMNSQQTPSVPITPAALQSDCCTKLQHISALKSFHWEYFSRLHSDSKYDMLSFGARCFHCSVDLVLTKPPS